MTPDKFSDTYLVARFHSGGVVVNLKTGNYFRVDSVAAQVCEVLTNGDASSVVAEVALRLEISPARAQQLVVDTRSVLDAEAVRGAPTGPYHFHPEKGGYGLWHAGKRVLGVIGDSLEIVVPPQAGIERSPLLELYVRALVPKLMFLRGQTILHASACEVGSLVVSFAGQSGAGKTTTAQAFVRAGARLISEDLLVLNDNVSRPSVVLGGEARAHSWAKRTAQALANGAVSVSSAELSKMSDGPHQAVTALLFLDAGRRAGSEIVTQSLSGQDGLLALMANEFLGDASTEGWRRFFVTAKSIASAIKLAEATAPLGLENLVAAARRQTSIWTSYGLADNGGPPSQA